MLVSPILTEVRMVTLKFWMDICKMVKISRPSSVHHSSTCFSEQHKIELIPEKRAETHR